MSQEEGNGNAEGSRSSGSTGRKRRSRLSTASTAIMNPNSTETYQANASSSSNNPALSGSEPNGYPMREEDTRRATRMLAQFRNGFRRSVLATEQGLPKPNDGTSEQEAMGMTTERGEEIQAPMNSTQIPDDVMRQDKKRRRIGEYAGPDDAMETDVGVSSVDPSECQECMTPFNSKLIRRTFKMKRHLPLIQSKSRQLHHLSRPAWFPSPIPILYWTTAYELWKRFAQCWEMMLRGGFRVSRV